MSCCEKENNCCNHFVLKWKKLNENAIIPQYQNKGDAGFDFHAIIDDQQNEKGFYTTILPKNQCVVHTGLACEIPLGWQMEIRPRSGLAFKHQLTVTNSPGTIDSTYRQEIMVLLYNLSGKSYKIYNGDRIAQGVMMPAPQFEMIEVQKLDENDRGGGFGSTGK